MRLLTLRLKNSFIGISSNRQGRDGALRGSADASISSVLLLKTLKVGVGEMIVVPLHHHCYVKQPHMLDVSLRSRQHNSHMTHICILTIAS